MTLVSSTGGFVEWEIESNAPWLDLSTSSGSTPSEITVSVDCNGLAPGVHQATLAVEPSSGGTAALVTAKLIINPATRVTLSRWRDGRRGAFSVSTDDSYAAGHNELLTYGLTGTFVMNGTEPPYFYEDMYAEGMELGAHLVSHYCFAVDEPTLRFEIEANIAGIQMATGSLNEIASLVWPCGFTSIEAQAIAAEYFLSARGYNINELEEATPANLMNLKSFNSHEHVPFPPADLKSIADAAEAQGKWANLVLHALTNDDGAIAYSRTKDLWVAPIGTVVKYILQRDRTVVSQYVENSSSISFQFSRLPISSSVRRNFEATIKPDDKVTFRVDVTNIPFVTGVTVAGTSVPFQVKTEGSAKFLYFSSVVGANPRTAQISLSNVVPPVLQLSTSEMTFTAPKGSPVVSQSINITNVGGGTLNWSVAVPSGDSGWLTVSPSSGSGAGTVVVTANTTALPEGVHLGSLTVSSANAFNGAVTVPVEFAVYPAAAETYVMDYPSRASLLADGWDYLAKRPNGTIRNTENSPQGDVIYSPWGLRVHADVGDLWEGMNSTRNTLFRNLPSNWKSVRVRLDFAPTQSFQQAGLAVYGDDDNYVQLSRIFLNGNYVSFSHEKNGIESYAETDEENATRNLYLRLDRNGSMITALYSLNGSGWTTLGSVNETFTTPKIALVTGGLDTNGGQPREGLAYATFHEVHVVVDTPPTAPVLTLSTTNVSFSANEGGEVAPEAIVIGNAGIGTLQWTASADSATQEWLSIAPASGSGNATIELDVDTAGLAPGTYFGSITIAATGAQQSPQVVPVRLVVYPAGTVIYDMRYTSRADLLSDGWDFQARTASGALRNTEQTSGATVVYDGVSPLRIPADTGDLWESLNSTRNSLFRDIPPQWTSVRVRLDFAPFQNYQQAGLMVYQDDDNYVQITRIFNNGQRMTFATESAGIAEVVTSVQETATTGLLLRLDRDIASNVISGLYSVDDGVTWTTLGHVTQTISDPRLGLVVGASPGGYPEATFYEVQVSSAGAAPPMLTLSKDSLDFAILEGGTAASQTISLSNSGAGSLVWSAEVGGSGPNWLSISPGAGTAPGELTVSVQGAGLAAGAYTRTITVTSDAPEGDRIVPVTLTVYPGEADEHYTFDYPNRTALLADGWDFLARTSSGALRNTEQLSGAVVAYDAENRVLRVPADFGDLWEGLNDTRNSIFRTLPADWTSVRLHLDFAPTQNYQQAGLVVYGDDDNYVHITRMHSNGQLIVLANEVGGTGSVLGTVSSSVTSNLFLRLDRDVATGVITGLYSIDTGSTWHPLGSVARTLSNPRLGLIVGASPGGHPEAVFRAVQVFADPPPVVPVLSLSTSSLGFALTEGGVSLPQTVQIENSAGGSFEWSAVIGGSGPQWLSISPTSGSGDGVMSASANAAGLSPGVYTRTITVTAPGAVNSPQTIEVSLVVSLTGSALYTMNYADRASLQADGWDFLARSATGSTRNTEQLNGAVVIYDANGPLRIPADAGDLWAGQNNTRNSLFRDLPEDWKSVWVQLDFAPTQSYQQAGLVIYQDDDNYVHLTRMFDTGQSMVFAREIGGAADVLSSAAVSATTDLFLRIDRDSDTDTLTGQFSLDGGQTWTVLGSVQQSLSSMRLGLIVGASPGGTPEAAFHSVQVHTDATPWLSLSSSSLSVAVQEAGAVAERSVDIAATGDWLPTWTASVSGGLQSEWLAVSPASGTGSATLNIEIDPAGLAPGQYSGSILVEAPGAVNGRQTMTVTLLVTPAGVSQFVLDYPDRASLLADGWDFLARTAGGAVRDTERTDGATVQYDRSGKLLIPADAGDLWEGLNNTRNSVFRDLPADWTSVRVELDFAPTQNYQQAGIVVYGDDDNYVQVTRMFNNGQWIVFVNETGGVASVPGSQSQTATEGLVLRLDRNAMNQVISGYYSVDGGATWTNLGGVGRTLSNPRLGLIVGASPSGFPGAHYRRAEVWTVN